MNRISMRHFPKNTTVLQMFKLRPFGEPGAALTHVLHPALDPQIGPSSLCSSDVFAAKRGEGSLEYGA